MQKGGKAATVLSSRIFLSLNNLNPFAIESLEAQSGCFTSSTFYRRKPAQLGLHCLPRGQYIPKRDERETRAAALMKISIKNGVNTGWLVCYVCSIGMTGAIFFFRDLLGTDHELTSFFFAICAADALEKTMILN